MSTSRTQRGGGEEGRRGGRLKSESVFMGVYVVCGVLQIVMEYLIGVDRDHDKGGGEEAADSSNINGALRVGSFPFLAKEVAEKH